MRLRYLITGTGRSGTVFMARLLTSVGIPCSHEAIFDYRGFRLAMQRLGGEAPMELSWVSRSRYESGKSTETAPWLTDLSAIEAESSYMVAPFLGEEALRDIPVIHVVRDPLKVVQSFCNYIQYFASVEPKDSYEHFIFTHLPELKHEMPQYDRACLYWVRWNQMVESRNPAYFHRIEDDPKGVLGFLGKEGPHFNDATVNSFKRPVSERFTLDTIKSKNIYEEFVALGKKYGYPMRSQYLLI